MLKGKWINKYTHHNLNPDHDHHHDHHHHTYDLDERTPPTYPDHNHHTTATRTTSLMSAAGERSSTLCIVRSRVLRASLWKMMITLHVSGGGASRLVVGRAAVSNVSARQSSCRGSRRARCCR